LWIPLRCASHYGRGLGDQAGGRICELGDQLPFELTELKLRSQVGLVDLDGTMREFARQAAADLKGAIAELASPFDGLVETSLILGDPDEDLLGDARANIKEHAYDVALAQLEEYLEDHPEHQDARYLRAFCLFQLYPDDDARLEDALRVLKKLAAEQLLEALAARVRELRHVLRKRQTPRRVDAYATAARGNPKAALAAAERYLELVPEEGVMSYLVAVGQLRAGNTLQALDTAERGAALADGDRQRVADLARALRTPVLRALAASAVASFKAGDYDGARMDLAQLEPRWRSAQVVRDFDRYLGSLSGRPRGPRLPAPNLPADRADELYSLIADADAQQAMELIMAGRLEQAQALLDGLMLLVPDFPWLNFVYAFLLYQQERRPSGPRRAPRSPPGTAPSPRPPNCSGRSRSGGSPSSSTPWWMSSLPSWSRCADPPSLPSLPSCGPASPCWPRGCRRSARRRRPRRAAR
jgi:hypothetical protein